MIYNPKISIDSRDAAKFGAELIARRSGYIPKWSPAEKGSDAALLQILARYLQAIVQRLNQAPDKNQLAFLDLLGIDLISPQAAKAPVVFQLAEQASDTRATAGTLLMALPPPESDDQIFFEIERSSGIAAAKLTEVVSLWSGRDQYIDHSEAFLAGESFQPFRKTQLGYTPHHIYLAHDTLLALAGKSTLNVTFDLARPGDEPLDVRWEYWDGKVWRGFKAMNQVCSQEQERKLDGTGGLIRSGSFRLEAECAETAKTSVNGMEAFWVRGRLTEPLLPGVGKALPEVDSIKLSSEVARPLSVSLDSSVIYAVAGRYTTKVKVQDKAGTPLHMVVGLLGFSKNAANVKHERYLTGNSGAKTVTALLGDFSRSEDFSPASSFTTEVTFTLATTGLKPDKAYSDGTALDLSKAFYPFGLQPQPGSIFYFTSDEVFSKPGAQVQVYIARTSSPQDETGDPDDGDDRRWADLVNDSSVKPLGHTVIWEYWNGRKWFPILQSSNSDAPSKDLNTTEIIEFPVPPDMVSTKVNDEDGLWMRARLASGGFGFKKGVTWNGQQNALTYVISQPPVLADFSFGYTWQQGPSHPERVLTYNDFQYKDRTYDTIWPGNIFLPFEPISDATPALYFGFDKQLPVDRLNLYMDIVEEMGETQGPALVWEYWDGSAWQEISMTDETNHLRIPGMLSFIAAEDSQPLARFGTKLYWLRGRLKEDGQPGEPLFSGIFLNAMWATQQQTFSDETLGISSGQPNQIFTFHQTPVLADERIEVRELTGARARVEWRILAMGVSGGGEDFVRELEEMLAQEGTQTDITRGDLRLRRDSDKQVTEVWVRWQEQPHLFSSGPEDRHYMLDRTFGRLFLGMREGSEVGVKGKIPPTGSVILAREYRAGGGAIGNIAENAISQLLGSVPGVESVFNPRSAEGGADRETLQALLVRGPQTVRHRGRAISVQDYETLAYEASAAVAVAQAIPTRNDKGIEIPGHLTLLIIPESEEPQPQPSFGLREKVRKFVQERAPADVAGAEHIYTVGPEYQPINVTATVAPIDPAEAGAVEQRVREALQEFLHPLRGGTERQGWGFGHNVFLSDVAAILERVEGVDYVEELALMLDGTLQGEQIKVPDGRVVAAGDVQIKIKLAEQGF